jgi:hypothetical protein
MAKRSWAGLVALAVLVACSESGSILAPPPDASMIDYGPVGDAAPVDSAILDGTSDGASTTCSGTPCQPIVLAYGTNPSGAGGIAVDATNVYWVDTTGGQVLACAKTGCNRSPTVLASGQGSPTGIAVAGSTVYWTNLGAGTVASCASAGCGGRPTVVASGLLAPGGITADLTNVYWVETGMGGGVKACALSGCATPTVLASAPGLLLAVDAANVYWTDGAGLNECPLAGCSSAPTLLFTATGATGIALDDTNAYVTTFVKTTTPPAYAFEGAVLACAKSGCQSKPVPLASALPAPLPVVVSSGTVYWGNTLGDTDLLSCVSAGCMGTPAVVSMAALPLSLAAFDTNLYWASLGAVLTFPK